jgi:hypothetical protein
VCSSDLETPKKWRFKYGIREQMIDRDGGKWEKPFASEAAAQSYVADYEKRRCDMLAEKRIRDAAPDLLAALERLYNAVDSATELTPQVLEQARAAIRKAKGEA